MIFSSHAAYRCVIFKSSRVISEPARFSRAYAVIVGASVGAIMEIASQSPHRVLLLGPLEVIQNSAQLPLPPSRKVRALLAFLAMAPRPVTREKLCELFWDVADDPKSELRWCLSKLRPLIDSPTTTRLIADRERVRIDTSSLYIDAISLTRSAQMTLASGFPGDLQSLRALFRGDFLEGLSVDRAPLFDNWLAGQRHHFGQLKQHLLERISAVLQPESDDRIEVLRECIEVAPFDEAVHIELIRTLLRRALYTEAEHQIEASVTLFQSEGIDPTSLKSALAATQRSVSKSTGMSLVDTAHNAPSSQPGMRTRMSNFIQRKSTPWRIGVLFSRTGFMSVIEESQYQGTLLAVDEVNDAGGVCGWELVPVAYNPASDSIAYGHYAKRLMVEDQVSTIFGCYTSSSRKAVLPVVERLNGLLWYPTLYEGFEASPNVIYTGASPNQNSLLLCRYLMDTFGTRFYFVGSDYIYPRQSNRVMRELLRANGGSVVGERYVNLRAHRQEFLPIIQDIKRLRPDAIFSTVVGEGTIFFYQAYANAGLDPKQMPIASLTTTEAEIAAMGFDVGAGHITAASYFQGIEGSANTAFVQRFKKRLGADIPTNMCAEASYFQLHLFAKALEQANTLDTEVLRSMVLGASFEAPQGAVRVNPMSGHTDLWTRIGRANREGQFDVVCQAKEPVHADPFLIGYGRATAKAGNV